MSPERAGSEPRSELVMKGVSHGFSSLLSPRVSKDKWNSPNGLEEKEIWVEEDQLFDVRGKPQIALALLGCLLECDAYCCCALCCGTLCPSETAASSEIRVHLVLLQQALAVSPKLLLNSGSSASACQVGITGM